MEIYLVRHGESQSIMIINTGIYILWTVRRPFDGKGYKSAKELSVYFKINTLTMYMYQI